MSPAPSENSEPEFSYSNNISSQQAVDSALLHKLDIARSKDEYIIEEGVDT